METEKHSRSPRESVLLMARVTSENDGGETQHRVRNLSETGVCLDRADGLNVGDRCLLKIGQAEPVGGTMMWAQGQLAGFQFDRAIVIADARARRGGAIPTPAAGWMVDLNDAYKSAPLGAKLR